MRPINVTLCSHTWELAKQKKNFSGWVRKQLDDEFKKSQIKERTQYHAYCETCDITFSHPSLEKAKNRCVKCWNHREYLGCDE